MRTLYPFQEATVRRIQDAPLNRLGIAFETGLGKTAVALTACQRVLAGRPSPRILVVTPAIVRAHWRDEFDVWYAEHPEVGLITMGRERLSGVSKSAKVERERAYSAHAQVVSYALLKHVARGPWDAIIFDEAHRLKKPDSIQSRQAREIAEANPKAMILPLTATPMPDDICDIWNPCDLTWPGRFGSTSSLKYVAYSFANRYSVFEPKHSETGEYYGGSYRGLNQARAQELQSRLAECWARVTKAEVAHLLPPFMVQPIKVAPDKQQHFVSVDDWLARQGEAKFPFVKEWLDDSVDTASHVCVLTHLRATAEAIGKAAQAYGRPVFVIDGAASPEARNEQLGLARREPMAIVVATMHSIGIGIDLTFCTQALFAELYWRPETVIQALGRFSRLSGKVPSACYLLCLQGTQDEAMAMSLLDKMDAMSKVVQAGASEAGAIEALGGLQMTESEALSSINAAIFGAEMSAF